MNLTLNTFHVALRFITLVREIVRETDILICKFGNQCNEPLLTIPCKFYIPFTSFDCDNTNDRIIVILINFNNMTVILILAII